MLSIKMLPFYCTILLWLFLCDNVINQNAAILVNQLILAFPMEPRTLCL